MSTKRSGREGGHVADQLPAYVAATLESPEHERVRTHLTHCASCRAELTHWEALASASRSALSPATVSVPSLALLDGIFAEIDTADAPTTTPQRAWSRRARAWGQVALGQAPIVPRGIWVLSTTAMLFSLLGALLFSRGAYLGSLLGIIVPLVTAVAVAFLYGPESDAGLEVALATPTSPRLVLLSRLALVFGYNFALALGVTLVLVLARGGDFALLISLWMGPMLLLAGCSLLLSVVFGAFTGMASVLGLVFLRLVTSAFGLLSDKLASTTSPASVIWQTNPVILTLAVVLFVAALIVVPRRERLA